MHRHGARGARVGVPVGQVPDRVEHGRDRDDPDTAERAALDADRDEHAGRECERDLRERKRGDQQRAGDQIAAAIGALDREQRPDAEGHRGEVADLERAEEVLVGSAHHQHRQHRGQRDPVSDAAAQVDEEQRHARDERGDRGDCVGQAVLHPEGRLDRLVDHCRTEDQMAGVRVEERMSVESAAGESAGPNRRSERRCATARRSAARPRRPARERAGSGRSSG